MNGRRRWFLWAGGAYIVVIAAVAAGLNGLYSGSRVRLDEAMGQRLFAVANSLTAAADGDLISNASFGDSTALYYLEDLRDRFEQVRQAGNLAEITLTDPLDDRVIFSTSAGLTAGETNVYWSLEQAAILQVKLGDAAVTPLYDRGGVFQKSAHAPVYSYDADGRFLVAVISVSGDPDFFEALATLRRAAYATGGAVLLILVVVAVFLSRIFAALERYRASVLRQENLAAIGRMTAGIAHEIRNPLGIIRGAGEHLQRVLDGAGINDEVAAFIPEEVDRLDQILEGYLAFGSDRQAPVESFDLGVCVQRGAALMTTELQLAGIGIDTTAVQPGLTVTGDPRRLQQVLLNLMINAKDAMTAGGTITFGWEASAAGVVLTVNDDGPGFPDRESERLFEPFWTTKEKGSGLGLAMSRRIVEDMGGTLDVLNRQDRQGARAVIRLPRSRTTEPAAEQ
jgi:signal transduction histidine kinase